MSWIRVHEGGEPAASEITPRAVYQTRRAWLRRAAALAAGVAATGDAAALAPRPGKLAALPAVASKVPGAQVFSKLTGYDDVTHYNNFYEFGLDKTDPARYAGSLHTRPWRVTVDGEVRRPRSFTIEELLALGPLEERIYRLRCVEGWSMVIPWIGYSLAALLARVEPTPDARYVEFTTLADRAQMPGLSRPVLAWPYTEGLRLDEAMHPLTLLAYGLYGEVLPNQNGAPVRLVVPWKYGFKSAKSIVRIRLIRTQPATAWNRAAPNEYGFYSNVNPEVDHPRWSQKTERRIGEDGLFSRGRPTLMFNGYGAQVASLYSGMDLRRNF